jgi:hypothetical protein
MLQVIKCLCDSTSNRPDALALVAANADPKEVMWMRLLWRLGTGIRTGRWGGGTSRAS